MPAVDLVDETFLVVDRSVLAAVVADPSRWAAWWPGLTLSVFMDRGLDGIRWSVPAEGSNRWAGSLEIWLEAVGDGVVLHHYARLDPVDPATGRPLPEPADLAGWRRAARQRARRARAWKRAVWALKDELEQGRVPGTPRTPGVSRSTGGTTAPA